MCDCCKSGKYDSEHQSLVFDATDEKYFIISSQTLQIFRLNGRVYAVHAVHVLPIFLKNWRYVGKHIFFQRRDG